MSQTLLILTELFLLGILSWYCITVESADIEADLEHRSMAALGYAGLEQLDITVDGQDVILSGAITSENQRELAVESVANVWGVSRIHDRLQQQEAEGRPAGSLTAKAPPSGNATTTAPQPPASAPYDHCRTQLTAMTRDQKLHFSLGSDELTDDSLPLLKRIARLMQHCPNQTLYINGHTDSIGRADDNLALSQARAEAVARQLTRLGVSPQRLQAVGKGESEPIADNTTAAGREINRRITFELQPMTDDEHHGEQQQ